MASVEDQRRRVRDFKRLMAQFEAMGEDAAKFARQLRKQHRKAGPMLDHILALQTQWAQEDLVATMAHANSYGVYEAKAIERILKVKAKPRTLKDIVADATRTSIRTAFEHQPVRQRELSDYQRLLNPEQALNAERNHVQKESKEEET